MILSFNLRCGWVDQYQIQNKHKVLSSVTRAAGMISSVTLLLLVIKTILYFNTWLKFACDTFINTTARKVIKKLRAKSHSHKTGGVSNTY